jgi:tRNA U34 5-methylaminomethyl-2-thiouridine-forming methyltransferase MnmC
MNDKYLIQTGDGTSTLFLEEYSQAMHSVSGAYEESLLKHVIPSGILDNESAILNVLDIGFGLGYNVLALMNEFINRNKTRELNIISLEKERFFLQFMNGIKFNDSRDAIYSFIKEVYVSGNGDFKNIKLKLVFGDAREALTEIKGTGFHAVFQDPFSPSKNPELWTIEYFRKLKQIMNEDAVLTTYSSADHIRRAMIEAGFKIGPGPSVGKKREGTIASVNGIHPLIEKERLDVIMSNLKSEPYTDPDFKSSREDILQERLQRIKDIKNAEKYFLK